MFRTKWYEGAELCSDFVRPCWYDTRVNTEMVGTFSGQRGTIYWKSSKRTLIMIL